MREVDEIGATCMYLALCESVPCTDITAEQLRALVSPVTCITTRVCAPRRCTASTGEGRSMLWPPSRARIESYEKTSAEGGVLLSFLRTSLSKHLCVRRRPEARRPLPHSDDSGPPGRATPPRTCRDMSRTCRDMSRACRGHVADMSRTRRGRVAGCRGCVVVCRDRSA